MTFEIADKTLSASMLVHQQPCQDFVVICRQMGWLCLGAM